MLINRRNALMAGKRLPYDAEVEYLESTGTQWIDTGLICDQNTDIVFSGRTRTVTTSTAFFFGTRVAFRERAFSACLAYDATTTLIRTQVGFGSFNGQNYLPRIPSDSDFVISNSGTTWSLTVGGQTTQVAATTSAFTTPTTALLFRMSNNGTPDDRSFSGAIYSVKLYQSGVLVRDFIPVRKGDVGYLYDRVSGRLFGNDGTGDFVLGPDVVPVEYIESHGTEWIDTGLTLQGTLGAKGVFAPLEYDGYLLGIDYNSVRFYTPTILNSSQVDYGYGNYFTQNKTLVLGSKITTSLNFLENRKAIVENSEYVLPEFPSGVYTARHIIAFGFYGYVSGVDGPRQKAVRAYSIQFSDGQDIVRAFRPVRVGTDATSWEGAMMDVLTRRIYRNAGTGAFTYGNDLKYPIPAE